MVEIALAVQFAPIVGLTPAHFGIFWKDYLGDPWAKPRATMPMEESFETFGPVYKAPQLQFRQIESPSGRIQLFDQDNDRVLQLQNNMLAYNWKKGATGYPSFDRTCEEFVGHLERFRSFLRDNSLEDVALNQWQLTYIDHVPSGPLWRRPADFHAVFPGLFPPQGGSIGDSLESQTATRRFVIEPRRGRVYLTAEGSIMEAGQGVLSLNSWARGPVTADTTIEVGLKLGHDWIGRSFVAVVSDAALNFWRGS